MTLVMEYQNRALCVSDFALEDELTYIIRLIRNGGRIVYSTENIFHRVKLAVLVGEIEYGAVMFRFNGVDFNPLDVWPAGFCRTLDGIFERTMLFRMEEYDAQQKG